MAPNPAQTSLFILLLLPSLSTISHGAAAANTSSPFDFIAQLQGSHKGYTSQNIPHLKLYLHLFGYLSHTHPFDDRFDDALASAVATYQRNFRIPPTGALDPPTVAKMVSPRCGVPDIVNATNFMQRSPSISASSQTLRIFSRYSFFPGNPRWPPNKTNLTYTFLPDFPAAAVGPVRRAFRRWAVASEYYFRFSEVGGGAPASDLTVGFFRGEHGDNQAFDGANGVLAHAFPPTDGRFHYDADEAWGVGAVAGTFDLESVAVHEIGHLLGLGHSEFEEAIMYPVFAPGTVKDIQADDIQGIRALYNY